MSKELQKIGKEWLNNIPIHWEKDRLKDICERVVGGGTPKSSISEYWDGGDIIWVSPTDFSAQNGNKIIEDSAKKITELGMQKSSATLIPKGTVVMSSRASIGEPKIAGCDITTNQGFVSYVPSFKIDSNFLFYLIDGHLGEYFAKIASGTTFMEITRKQAKHEHIPLPPLPEQKAIADYLDKACKRIDSIIDIKQKQLEKIEGYLRSTIDSIFRNGIKGNEISKKVDGFEYLGKVPENWKVIQLKFVFDFLDYKRVPLSSAERGEMANKTYDYYGASGVIDKVEDYIFDEPLILIGEDGANLLTRSKPLTFIAEGKYWVNNHAHILKPKFGNIKFWCILLERIDYSLYVTGAAQPKLSSTNLGRLKIAFPKTKIEQDEILEKISRLEENTKVLKENIKSQITALQSYRKSLIHECVTGKKQVWEGELENVN